MSAVFATAVFIFNSMGYWHSQFIWDDPEIFGHVSQTDWRQLWVEPVTGGRLGKGYYRPLSMTILKWCGGTYWAHVCSTVCHILSALALAFLLNQRAYVCVLIFLFHPLSNEILGWASALPDALALSFGLWSAVAATRQKWILTFVLVLLGGMSKETAWVPLLALLLSAPKDSGMKHGWLAFGVAFGAVFGMRIWSGVIGGWTILTKLTLLPKALAWAMSLLIWPWPLSVVREVHVVSLLSIVLGLTVLCVLVFSLRRESTRSGALMILLSIGLALPTTVDGGMLGERYCYMATAGLTLWVGTLSVQLKSQYRYGLGALICMLALVFVSTHVQRSPDWRSDSVLFDAAAVAYPDSTYAQHFVGMVALREGQLNKASTAFEKALTSNHAHSNDRWLYMMSLVEAERYSEAIQFAETGEQKHLEAEFIAYWAKAYVNIGQADSAQGLLQILCPSGVHCDGPDWVQELYVTALKD
ncbi:MAG: tetratricopeptide repeat protein [Myxococcota bacterium]